MTWWIIDVDQWVQRQIDAAVVWLMHRGVPKSLTMYAVTCLGIAAMMTKSAIGGGAVGMAITAAIGALCILQAESNRRTDEKCEGSDVMSTADATRWLLRTWQWKGWCAFGAVVFPWTYPSVELAALTVVSWSAFLLQCYVANSPRRAPPAKKESKAASVTPLPVRA